MKILWLSAKVLSKYDGGTTGTWLEAMAQSLAATGQVELGILAQGRVKKCVRRDYGPAPQWVVPESSQHGRSISLSPRWISMAQELIEHFSPDVIHVWGTENNWGLFTARNSTRFPVLLEMQGLRGVTSRVFDGGLSFREQLACIGLKEILLHTSISDWRKKFKNWDSYDREIISGHRLIASHSDWMVAQVRAINPRALIFRNERMIRQSFYQHTPWTYSGNLRIFCSAAYSSPYKGLHVAVRSLAFLKEHFPDIQLRIAGAHQRSGLRQEGYIAWINREVCRLNVEKNVVWLGPLSGTEIVEELSGCSACVLPTFAESYCVALAEAMVLGVPTVVAFNGGTSYLAKDNDSALFFPPGDEVMCAYQLEHLLIDRVFAEEVSNRARTLALARNNPDHIVRKQMEIYKCILAKTRLGTYPGENGLMDCRTDEIHAADGMALGTDFLSKTLVK